MKVLCVLQFCDWIFNLLYKVMFDEEKVNHGMILFAHQDRMNTYFRKI